MPMVRLHSRLSLCWLSTHLEAHVLLAHWPGGEVHSEFDSIGAVSCSLPDQYFQNLNSKVQSLGQDNEHGIRYIGASRGLCRFISDQTCSPGLFLLCDDTQSQMDRCPFNPSPTNEVAAHTHAHRAVKLKRLAWLTRAQFSSASRLSMLRLVIESKLYIQTPQLC